MLYAYAYPEAEHGGDRKRSDERSSFAAKLDCSRLTSLSERFGQASCYMRSTARQIIAHVGNGPGRSFASPVSPDPLAGELARPLPRGSRRAQAKRASKAGDLALEIDEMHDVGVGRLRRQRALQDRQPLGLHSPNRSRRGFPLKRLNATGPEDIL